MISAMLGYWNSLGVSQVRARRLPGWLVPHVPKGGSVLDVGSGDGYIASRLLREGGAAAVCGVDVLPCAAPLVPMIEFDGEHLPYDDGAFDLVTLVDVLHHTDHPQKLLAEAVRVSRGRVLIKDHYWDTRLDHWILSLADYVGNKPNGVSLPYNFLRMDQWAALFAGLSLTEVSRQQFRYAPYDWPKQVIFVVEAPAREAALSGMSTAMG